MKPTKGKAQARAPLGWVALVAVLAALAYASGAVLARRWTPSLALPEGTAAPQAKEAAWIVPGQTADGTIGAEAADEWQFQAQAGQSTTVEMWFHPGSGSNVEAELAIRLITPDGTILTEKQGSIFLPPYVFEPSLPVTGIYRIRVFSVSGSPGRYSLGLTLSEPPAQARPGVTPTHPTAAPPDNLPAEAAKQFQWPTSRRTISGWTFHDPGNPGHIGLDIAAKQWDPIVAVAGGEVVFAEWGGGYGNLVILDHRNGWRSYYAHLTEISVDVGQRVRQGETLGGAGTTGYSTGTHLHFELRYQGRPVDPHIYLP
jgi:murein DD-endopeptidase MepM/ murein hydrolase activator NlpD